MDEKTRHERIKNKDANAFFFFFGVLNDANFLGTIATRGFSDKREIHIYIHIHD